MTSVALVSFLASDREGDETMTEWQPVSLVGAPKFTNDDADPNLITWEWELSRPTEREWQAFANGHGQGRINHRVDFGSTTARFRCPSSELEDYTKTIRDRISNANSSYQSRVLPGIKAAEEAARKDVALRAKAAEEARKAIERMQGR